MTRPYALALHGGAGTIPRDGPDNGAAQLRGLHDALQVGRSVLEDGGSSLDAVVAAVKALEDCPLFNAGRGAVFNEEESHELDAAVMDGATLRAGAVAGLSRIRNPVSAALEVMQEGRSVILCGAGAEKFAIRQGLEVVPPDYFSTPYRRQQLHELRRHGDKRQALDHDVSAMSDGRFGTVGAVALDRNGHLSSATSTGGMTNKQVGRIGDTPVIGAGTYANDATCAISATGTGEAFIRACVGYDVHARMLYAGQPLSIAVEQCLAQGVAPLGGQGGLIGIDSRGEVVIRFNSTGLYRAWLREGDEPQAAIF